MTQDHVEPTEQTEKEQQPKANGPSGTEPDSLPEASKPLTRRQQRQLRRQRDKAYFAREKDLSPRQAKRLARTRRQAARRLGAPDIGKTGVPVKRHPWRAAFSLLACGVLILFAGAYFAFDMAHWQPLDIRRITAAPQTGAMYDNQGQLITKIRGAENRVVVPLDDIPTETRQRASTPGFFFSGWLGKGCQVGTCIMDAGSP